MTENDKKLIKQALNATYWDELSGLEEKADTDLTRKIIHNRKMDLYHREEASAGQL